MRDVKADSWIELALACYKDGKLIGMKEYRREGDVEVIEQLTSWSRECARDFYGVMKEGK